MLHPGARNLLTFAFGCWIAASGMLLGCKTTEYELEEAGGAGYTVTFYDPGQFGNRCSPPPGVSSSNGIAPAEGLFGVSCTDNWKEVPDPQNVQDVEPGDISAAQQKGQKISSKFDFLKKAAELCGGKCVKMNGGKYQINLPTCSSTCGNRTFTMTTNKTGDKAFKVFIESACPARHWKNLAKAAMGIDNNHCGTPSHIDISTSMTQELGLSSHDQEGLIAYVSEGEGGPVQTPNPGGPGTNSKQNSNPKQNQNPIKGGYPAPQGDGGELPPCQYPESDDIIDGYGWENGKSCRAQQGQPQAPAPEQAPQPVWPWWW